VEFDSYQESIPVGYAEGETMAINGVEWADEASMSPLQFTIPG
jgi:hypothetical protein